jgi:hypothetical protein
VTLQYGRTRSNILLKVQNTGTIKTKEFQMSASIAVFNVLETTIEDIHSAYQSGQLTARQLVQAYLDRIAGYDKQGPAINAIITINSSALDEADRLEAAFKASGFVGPLHGIPIIIKDQADAKGMPTTLGSVLFENYYPDRDAFVVEKLKKAGAIILTKATLGELAAVIPMVPYSAPLETPTIWNEPPEAPPAAPEPASRQTFVRSPSDRKALRRSPVPRHGTRLPA